MDIKNNRKNFLFGTWKNKLNIVDSINLLNGIKKHTLAHPTRIVGVCPSSAALQIVASLACKIPIAAQNCGWFDKFSLTGEINCHDLVALNIKYCIVGHSERRIYLNEDEKIILNRLSELFKNNIIPILCVGEQLLDKEEGRLLSVLDTQINTLCKAIEKKDNNINPSSFIIAYEPMWAISTSGSGKILGSEDADKIHSSIREVLNKKLGDDFSINTSIIYGGSLSPVNALEFFSKENIDGGLIGSATQSLESFVELIKIFYNH